MRYFVYVLRSTRVDRLYIGSSVEPDERLKPHNFGRVCSTKAWRPGAGFACPVIPPTVENVVAFDPQADHHAKNRNSMRYYLYVLRSTRADRLYIGSSAEPDERLKSHNFGRVCSAKAWRPWERVLLEEYQDRATAEKRERYLKSGWGRRELAALLERWQSG